MKTLGKEYTNTIERSTFLKDNCDTVETKGYMKKFTPEKITELKSELSEISIQINDIEHEKKMVMADFKQQIDPLNDLRKELLTNIKQKAEYVKETVYKFIDHEARMVEFYNSEGDCIDERPATADEMQKTIFQMKRAANQ